MAQAPSKRAVAVRGMGQWVPGAGYGAPGSLYHDDGFCDAPYVPGTLACPACVAPEAAAALTPLAAVQAERIAWLEAGRHGGTSIAKVDAHAAAMPPKRDASRRSNRYGGKCVRCGQWVEAEAGYLAKDTAGRWAAEHPECPAPKAAAPARAAVEPGMYWDADGDPVKVQRSRTSGGLYVKSVDGEYLGGVAKHPGLVRMTLEEAKAYGRRTGQCCCCGAELTDPASIAAGIGPICASKF